MPKKLKDDEKGNLENGDSDSHQHPDGHRHLARRNELHVRRKEILHGLIFKINQMYATTAPPYYLKVERFYYVRTYSPVISGHGHFRSFSNQHIDDDGSTEERGYSIERDNSTIRRQRAEQIAEQG